MSFDIKLECYGILTMYSSLLYQLMHILYTYFVDCETTKLNTTYGIYSYGVNCYGSVNKIYHSETLIFLQSVTHNFW